MHIPDGVLDPVALTVTGVAAVGAVGAAGWSLRRGSPRVASALVGAGAVLAAHLVDVPVYGAHTAHLVGGALLAIALGPWLGLVVMAAVLALEALVLADGGVLALGANVVVMGVVGVLVGWAVYRGVLRLVAGTGSVGSISDAWRVGAAALAAGASVLASSVVLVGVLAMGGAAVAVSGAALEVLIPHHLLWALLEGALTGAVVAVGLAWRRSRARALARAAVARQVHVLDGDLDTLG
ncbi:energy-coupling factor ABC transporter permease [Demequina sp. SYSU T00039]|uniref:Energy-coupling factor ABC transporter permease n=1 Tax=Demequina lignilytica TaxID=3051663 RepID=A0AAW7M832_9MICO|nr:MULTISPECIES: energy-coupling factor ABC transporter permease [unclassified Demequina]MDN4477282.1 energy-coupling factor ABC transporter permease [Demequina sp. SYSU T00039-1]MDN4487455.1 energy-coupling factor ABC transporter permease [Demequina sp. SYSU T00039]